MDKLSRKDLEPLLEATPAPCVSLYLPAHRAGPEAKEERIRLKNLLREAEARLGEAGMRAPEAREMLQPARSLLEEGSFSRERGDGLAIFLSRGFFRRFLLAWSFPEQVVVGSCFYLRPLLPLLWGDGEYHLLALSQKRLRLFRGTRDSLAEVDLEGVPGSLSEALRFDVFEKQFQMHSASAGGQSRAAMVQHGVGIEDPKSILLRYFREVDRGLREILHGSEAPLVLAGVDYLHPLFREASSYPHLLPEGIAGNPEGLSHEELREKAWRLVAPRYRKEEAERERYRELAGRGRGSHVLEELLPAAREGRVETLFLDAQAERWGKFAGGNGRVEVHGERRVGDEELLNLAVVFTLRTGGVAYAVEADRMPGASVSAALFRY